MEYEAIVILISNAVCHQTVSALSGLEKSTSGCLGQVDFPSGQVPVTFHSHLPNR